MGQERDVKCHYVQQARLKEFAVREGEHFKLVTVDLERKKIGTRNVESAFYVRGLYPRDVEAELNSKIEAPGMKVFEEVYKNRGAVLLTRDQLETMKKYLLVQLYRNPVNMSHYSPDWEGDVLGVNKAFKNDAEANLHVAKQIHKICNSTWDELKNSDDFELRNNILEINQTMTLFVRTDVLEFVINDLGSVSERKPRERYPREAVRIVLGQVPGLKVTDEMIDEFIETHQYYDNFNFYPISSHFGIITLDPIWTQLIIAKQPFTITKSIVPGRLIDVEVDREFFKWAEKEMQVQSDFIQELFVPCIPMYVDDRINNAKPEEKMEMIAKYSSPKDRYFYPVVDLNLEWTEYLNRLTINEAKQFFAFGSIRDGKVSIGNYQMIAAMMPGAKNDLSWIDFDADWTQSFG